MNEGKNDPQAKLIMQTDGNLVLYDGSGHPRWASNTSNNPGGVLTVGDNGNLLIRRKLSAGGKSSFQLLWQSNTAQGAAPAPGAAPFTEVRGANSYCSCTCSAAGGSRSHTMRVDAGAPFLYAVLTQGDDSVGFPKGAVLTIQGPDGTKYDHQIQTENQLVIMSGPSVQCLIIKNPKPGNWALGVTASAGVGFRFECSTVPSRDVYDTIVSAHESRLAPRDFSVVGFEGFVSLWYLLAPEVVIAGPPGLFIAALITAVLSIGIGAYLLGRQDSLNSEQIYQSYVLGPPVAAPSSRGQPSPTQSQTQAAGRASFISGFSSTTKQKQDKNRPPSVYAVIHDERGRFILFRKNAQGYFFHQGSPSSNAGTIYPNGIPLPNGGGDYALPGGGLQAGLDPIAGALLEFYEETGVDLTGPLVRVNMPNVLAYPAIFQDAANPPAFYGVYLNARNNFDAILDHVEQGIAFRVLAAEAVREHRIG